MNLKKECRLEKDAAEREQTKDAKDVLKNEMNLNLKKHIGK